MLKESISPHDTLNPKIWDSDNNLLKDVEDKILEIVEYFKNFVSIPLEIADVHLVGSNASYNYTDTSDLDVHIVTNFSLMNADNEIVQSAYNKERKDFNNTYDISIHGINVEMYIEDIRSATMSNGIYSIYSKKWLKFPKPLEPIDFDFSDIISKWRDRVDFVKDSGNADDIRKLINGIYLMRKNSLQIDGEQGAGNLLFKELRKLGIIQELNDELTKLDSKNLSLESLTENLLLEVSRQSLMTKSKTSKEGNKRFKRRVKSKVANQVKQFNSIDMNKLFKQDILTINVSVKGETSDYIVRISFGGLLDRLQRQLKNASDIDLKVVTRSLIECFNQDDVYIHCSCPDWKYRFAYWATKNNINSGEPQNSNGKEIRNPDDRLGSGCKHTLLVLSNTSWLIKVASVIKNYIKYMEKHYSQQYADIIYPAVFGRDYEEPVQTSFFDDELVSDEDTLDIANKMGATSTQFKKGNVQGVRFAKTGDGQQSKGQQSLFND